MHFNFHFLKFICPVLEQRFKDTKITSCFSQNKAELIIGCSGEDGQRYIRANLFPSISCMDFPEDFKRGKKNTVSLLHEIIGKTIISVNLVPNERAFTIGLSGGGILLFKLHGSRSNILYYQNEEELPRLIFRNDLIDDKTLSLSELPKNFDLNYTRFEELEGNASRFLPTLGKIPREWLQEKGYKEADVSQKWMLMQELLDMLESPLFSIVNKDGEHVLSLLPEENPVFQTSNPVEACNELFRYVVVIQAFEKEKNHWIKIFEDQKKKSQAYISKTSLKLDALEQETTPAQTADVIMANLHLISSNQDEVSLFNFYTQQEETIKLKRGQTPQKFAENLYRKSKNRKIEINQLRQNLGEKHKLIEHLDEMLDNIHQIHHFRSLKEFIKSNNLITKEKESQEQLPYKRFEEDSFEILVGKSAKANDELLRHFAWKEDMWLHAKDVSGSHVLIKFKSGLKFPKNVVERAAELAAYYSKNKNESLAAVTYTPAKHVRKVKGSQAGAVIVDKEDVLMVVPKGPS